MPREYQVKIKVDSADAEKALGGFSSFTTSQMRRVEDFVAKSAKRQAAVQKKEAEDNAKYQRQTMEKLLADESKLIAQENKKRQRDAILENKAILQQAVNRAKEEERIQKEYDKLHTESSKKRQQEAVLESHPRRSRKQGEGTGTDSEGIRQALRAVIEETPAGSRT